MTSSCRRVSSAGPARRPRGADPRHAAAPGTGWLEAQVSFPALLTRFPRLALAGQPVGREGIALHGHARLPVSAR
jgi:hypothetical protein